MANNSATPQNMVDQNYYAQQAIARDAQERLRQQAKEEEERRRRERDRSVDR